MSKFTMEKYLALLIVAVMKCVILAEDEDYSNNFHHFEFAAGCKRAIYERMEEYTQPQSYIDKNMSFVYPCKLCRLTNLKVFDSSKNVTHPHSKEYQGRFEEKNFFWSAPFQIQSYSGYCECHLHATETEISKAFKTINDERLSNSTCVRPHSDHPKTFNTSKLKECFHPKDLTSKLKDPMAKIEIHGVNIHTLVNFTDRVFTDDKGEKRVRYYILHADEYVRSPPKVICKPDDKADSYEAKTCKCLKNAGFFDMLPTAIIQHVIKCGDLKKELPAYHDPLYKHSCRYMAIEAKVKPGDFDDDDDDDDEE